MLPNIVVSISGGGYRGLASYIFIRDYLLNHYAPNLLVGTSIGAILSSLLSLDMLHIIKDEQIIEMHKNIFEKEYSFSFSNLLKPINTGKNKSAFFEKIFGNKNLGDCNIPVCFVLSTLDGRPVIIKSICKEDKDILIRDILDAATAVPIYFPSVSVGKYGNLCDACMYCPDQSMIAVNEAIVMFGANNFKLINVNTPYESDLTPQKNTKNEGLIFWINKYMKTSFNTHEELDVLLSNLLEKKNYLCMNFKTNIFFDEKINEVQWGNVINLVKDKYEKEFVPWMELLH